MENWHLVFVLPTKRPVIFQFAGLPSVGHNFFSPPFGGRLQWARKTTIGLRRWILVAIKSSLLYIPWTFMFFFHKYIIMSRVYHCVSIYIYTYDSQHTIRGDRSSPLQLSSIEVSLDQGSNTHSHWHMNMCIDNDAKGKYACSQTWTQHFLDCTRHGVEQSQWLIANMTGCKICLQPNESGDRRWAQTQINMSEPAVRPKLLYAKKEQNRFYPSAKGLFISFHFGNEIWWVVETSQPTPIQGWAGREKNPSGWKWSLSWVQNGKRPIVLSIQTIVHAMTQYQITRYTIKIKRIYPQTGEVYMIRESWTVLQSPSLVPDLPHR